MNGFHITTEAARIRVQDQEFRIGVRHHRTGRIVTALRKQSESYQSQFWADSIMNMHSKGPPHSRQCDFCGPQRVLNSAAIAALANAVAVHVVIYGSTTERLGELASMAIPQ